MIFGNAAIAVRLVAFLGLLGLGALAAGCAAQAPSGAGQSGDDTATLRQMIVAQQTQVATLQGEVRGLQTAVAPLKAGAVPTVRPVIPVIPTLVPPVAGLVASGLTKGRADAKVTLDDYSDFQ